MADTRSNQRISFIADDVLWVRINMIMSRNTMRNKFPVTLAETVSELLDMGLEQDRLNEVRRGQIEEEISLEYKEAQLRKLKREELKEKRAEKARKTREANLAREMANP